ncbi:MAG: hypothetical protein CMQ52_00065 [Gammaproteobacteria bacterium]|nr:hypothetical protein [Gammaproteobacteria bacterium]
MKKKLLLIFILYIYQGYSQTNQIFKEVDSLIIKGRIQSALKKLNQLEPSFEKYSKQAAIYYQIDKTKKALINYNKALDIRDDYKTKIQLGRAYQKVKDYDNVIRIYEDILENDSLNLLIKYQLGKIYLIKRKATLAIKTFQELSNIDTTNANYSYQKGIAYAMKKQRSKMIDSFLEAYETDSTHIKSINQLATSFAKLGDRDSTFLFINKGLRIDPNHFKLNKSKINLLYKEEKYQEVLPILINLNKIYPNSISVINMLGRVYYSMGEYENSKEQFLKSKKLDKGNFKTYTYLGHVAMKMKSFNEARINYSMAIIFASNKLDEEYYGLGNLELKMENPKVAMEMFEKSYNANKQNHKALYQLAKTTDDFYIDKKQAYKYFREYIFYFEDINTGLTNYVNKRIKDIKKDYFLKGKKID